MGNFSVFDKNSIIFFILIIYIDVSYEELKNDEPCWKISTKNETILKCTDIAELKTHPRDDSITSIIAAYTSLSRKREFSELDVTLLNNFKNVQNVIVSGFIISNIVGVLPPYIKSLNLSFNSISNMNSSVLSNNFQLISLDLSHNFLKEIPTAIFSLPLQKLNLEGNKIPCKWMTNQEKIFKWVLRNLKVIETLHFTLCESEDEVFENKTFIGAIRVRERAIAECNLTPFCSCDIWATIYNKFPSSSYPIVHSDLYGNISFSLEQDCSGQNLTALPPNISIFTVALSVEKNRISDLSPLYNNPNYKHIQSIILDSNDIKDLKPIVSSEFFKHVVHFRIRNNSFNELTEDIFSTIFKHNDSLNRIKEISLGQNRVNCNCDTFMKVKPNLITYESIFTDWKSIECISPLVSIFNLRIHEVCEIKSDIESGFETQWWTIAGIEAFLIIIILLKLWSDHRAYRLTGKLPLISACIPRLPCDFMLEGIQSSNSNRKNSYHQSTQNKL